jgi:chorismate mutase
MAEGSGVTDDLEDLRRRIDLLDDHLVRLLNARAACALEIGRLKRQLGMDIYQPAREFEVLTHVAAVNTGPLDTPALRRLFERIIDEARRLERLADEARSAEGGGVTAAEAVDALVVDETLPKRSDQSVE